MKTDLYTKAVLTVIALCLAVIVLNQTNLVPKAYASETFEKPVLNTNYAVVPLSESNTIDVRIVDINTYDELNVNLKGIDSYDEMKVNIKSIDTSDELDVNIDEVGGSWVSAGGPIKVKID